METFTREEDLADAYVTLCIHAGIAASDVISCKRLGEHAQGDDHGEAVSLFVAVDGKLAEDLRALLGMKTKAGTAKCPRARRMSSERGDRRNGSLTLPRRRCGTDAPRLWRIKTLVEAIERAVRSR